MGLRKVTAFEDGDRRAVVYKDSEWMEYRTRFYERGALLPDADYHDTDRAASQDTARAWVVDRVDLLELPQ